MDSYTIIIFGGTGDLTKSKLISALNELVKKDNLTFNVIGIGRRELDDSTYKSFLLETNPNIDEKIIIKYFKADFEKRESLNGLDSVINSVENETCKGRIYYLATSYHFFEYIAENLAVHSSPHKTGFTRIMVEKPFGHDLKSSNKINNALLKHFDEEQIFRVDHYLAKQTIDNILLVRLSNPFFESTWNSQFIEKIKVVVKEDKGVGNRLGYYDKSGAVKDMIQNHLLQTAAFVLMEPPDSLEIKDLKKRKIEAINKLEFKGEILTGQYAGYRDEAASLNNPNSTTETFAEVKLISGSKRWKGTEIILRTGKMLKKREAYIEIDYKKEPCMMYCNLTTAPNRLIMHIQPLQNIEFTMNTTMPGEESNIKPVKMTFSPTTEFKSDSAKSYALIIKECIKGSKKMFICKNELEATWKLTDKITKQIKNVLPEEYEKNSTGPRWNSNKLSL